MTDRRSKTRDPHPDYADAVSVSRFWRLVGPEEIGGCRPWTGDTDRDGYGVFTYRGRRYGAHELALSFTYGEKRHPSLDTCHTCDNPPCCNPDHLRFDTRTANIADMDARGRRTSAAKLSERQVVEMRERRARGARQKDLARDYGVTDGQVSMILRGIRWRDAGGPIETSRKYNRG